MVNNKKIQSFVLSDEIIWHHFSYASDSAKKWLNKQSNISDQAKNILLSEDTRPRLVIEDQSIIMCLRGINLNKDNNPEDMISIRIWMDENTLLTSCNRESQSILNIQKLIHANIGPKSVPELLILLIEQLALITGEFVDTLDNVLDSEEDTIAHNTFEQFNPKMSQLRRQIATIKRYLAPQREALDKLYRSKNQQFGEGFFEDLYIQIDKFIFILENLELLRERALVLQEQFNAYISQQQNSRLYLLAIVSVIFLPLSFLSGLFGMNVGGMPGLETASAFWLVLGFCFTVTAILMYLFKKYKWF